MHLTAEGSTVRLTVPGWPELRLLAGQPGRRRRRSLHVAGTVLEGLGLALRVEMAGRVILGIGPGMRTNWLARLLGLAPARVPMSAIAVVLGSRSGRGT